jgi:outer membrane protein assembly factor BamE
MLYRRVILSLGILLLSQSLTGCLFKGYRYEVQQGNILTTTQVQSIQIGMTEQQVFNRLGFPVLRKLYLDNQLTYVYTMKPGHGKFVVEYLILSFSNGRVSNIQTNLSPPPL